MKTSSKTMYLIGFIFNIFTILVLTIIAILLGVAYGSTEIIQQVATEAGQGFEEAKAVILGLVIGFSIALTINIILIFLVAHARKNLSEGNGRKTTHIVLLIVGILDVNVFYLLGGVFGLVAASDDCEIED
jgi:hypothetical protein